MKTFTCLFLATALTSSADIVDFALSPPGTDMAVGMVPQNEVPAVTNSTGSGSEIAPGIFLNTATAQLGFAIGYGSSAGFTDLTGLPTGMHFHTPAGPGTNAPVMLDLATFHVPAAVPAQGGMILGAVTLTTNQTADILDQLVYVNIQTALNPGGEIRAQLIPVATNFPPTLICPAVGVAECATAATLTAVVADPEGDAITVVWMVNGVATQTNSVPAGATNAPNSVSLTRVFPLGTNVIGVVASDSAGNNTVCASTLTVVDTTPPVIVSVTTSANTLWPPNHKMVAIEVRAVVTDTCSTATWRVAAITSNEPVSGKGSGNTSPDWLIVDDNSIKLRAERAGSAGDRIYTITIRATDLSGNQSTATVTITVPHDQSGKVKPTTPAAGKGNGSSANTGSANAGSGRGNSNGGRGH